MKRSAIQRNAPAPRPAKQIEGYTPKPRAVAASVSDGKSRMVVPIPKAAPFRSESYRRLVADLPCANCGKPGPSQAAHADEGKGMGIKSSDLTCYPLCADGPGWRGCHALIGAGGVFTREQRRKLEAVFGAQTRQHLGAEYVAKLKGRWFEA